MTSQRALQVLKQKDETFSFAFQKSVLIAMQGDWMGLGREERLESREEAGQVSHRGVIGAWVGRRWEVGMENALCGPLASGECSEVPNLTTGVVAPPYHVTPPYFPSQS